MAEVSAPQGPALWGDACAGDGAPRSATEQSSLNPHSHGCWMQSVQTFGRKVRGAASAAGGWAGRWCPAGCGGACLLDAGLC